MTERTGSSISFLRKILLWAFVIGVWILFYWYQGTRYSNDKPASVTTHPTQTEPPVTKK